MAERHPDIIRGKMTADEKAEIERLALTLKNPKPGPIANKLRRHPATVAWYMLRRGLLTRHRQSIRKSFTNKAGVTHHGWTPEQDARLEQLLCEGKNYRQAGDILTAEFGIPRNTHKCQVRAVLLAASSDEADV